MAGPPEKGDLLPPLLTCWLLSRKDPCDHVGPHLDHPGDPSHRKVLNGITMVGRIKAPWGFPGSPLAHFPGRAGGSASLPSLAGCHRAQMWKSWAPASLLPPKQSPTPTDPALNLSLRAAPRHLRFSLCHSARGERVILREDVGREGTSLACFLQLHPGSQAPGFVGRRRGQQQ